jgi:hypothetical protein
MIRSMLTITCAVALGVFGAACSSATEGEPVGSSAASLTVVPIGAAEKRSLRTVASPSTNVENGAMARKANGITIAGAPSTSAGWSKAVFAELDENGRVVASMEFDSAAVASTKESAGTKTQSLRIADYDPGGGGTTCRDFNECQSARSYENETLLNFLGALGTDVDWVYAIAYYAAIRNTQYWCSGCP